MMTHIYNPCYLGDRDWEDHGLRSALAKVYNIPVSANKLCLVACACLSRYEGGVNRKTSVQVSPRQRLQIQFEK
jgi:hypothetical protein